MTKILFRQLITALVTTSLFVGVCSAADLEIAGVSVTPHLMLDSMRYRRPPEPPDGARVQIFLRNAGDTLTLNSETRLRFDGKPPALLLMTRAWAWHDTPAATPGEAITLPKGAMTVWTFNSRQAPFGAGGRVPIEIGPEENPWLSASLDLAAPQCWISAITFLAHADSVQPNFIIGHVANESDSPVEMRALRIWLPRDPKSPRVLFPEREINITGFKGHQMIPPKEKGGFRLSTTFLPLTYAAVEVELAGPDGKPFSIWSHLRIKPERFDISGGWVNGGNHLKDELFLKTLKRLHINTAHIANTPGYTDTDLYEKYPLKYFNKLQPFEVYDTDEMLPRIHAVEFLGEPQYGGGKPVPPQEVWQELHPYAKTRLPTSLTHSEERIWRDYAGLSDYPHYDAYRVTAPSADSWRMYDRWDGQRIGWGAPLETIGDMSRSLRELNRPMPVAYWSQGPHEGWDVYGGRKRTSPTPDEIRLQAYHAVSTRITSLYWFNLSLKTLVQWRDTLDELGRIGRELRTIENLLLEGDAYRHARLKKPDGKLDWDIASVCGPDGALLFALDLDYVPDPEEKVFKFGPPRKAEWKFELPAYLNEIQDVFRFDADGVYGVDWSADDDGVTIRDEASRVAIYIASPNDRLRGLIRIRRDIQEAVDAHYGFDPARSDEDFNALAKLLESE